MGYYGIQPDGRVRIAGGQLWDPNDPLPSEAAANFNATPNGNPLIPSSLPRLSPTAPTAAPSGLSAPAGGSTLPSYVGFPAGGADASPPQAQQPSWIDQILKANSLPTSADLQASPPSAPRGMFGAQPARPSFFGEGGTGRTIAGVVGDALLAANNRPMIYAPAREKQMEFAKSAFQQQQELMRQLQLAQYKQDHPDETEPVKNARALGLTPGTKPFNDYVYNATMAPVITTVNNQPMAYSRQQLNEGIAASGGGTAPSFPRVTDAASYNALKSGDHFLDPDGNVRVKP